MWEVIFNILKYRGYDENIQKTLNKQREAGVD